MKKRAFIYLIALAAITGASIAERASADIREAFPTNVSCQLSLDAQGSPDAISIENVARSCNEFKVQNELEFNLVKGSCILGGKLSGLMSAFSDGICDSEHAAALCLVPVQSTGFDEVTWYFEPNSPQGDEASHQDAFRASCDKLGGKFESLSY